MNQTEITCLRTHGVIGLKNRSSGIRYTYSISIRPLPKWF